MTAQNTPNPGQQAALDSFLQFMMSPEKFFHLQGPAGTGKTFVLGLMIDTIMEAYRQSCELLQIPQTIKDVVYTATTNKAAEGLAVATQRPTETLHSFLRYVVKEDYKTGKTKLERKRDHRVVQNMLIVVEECSMVDQQLYQALIDSTANCKILFVGDESQLAPVFEEKSKVYRHEQYKAVLTEPMRNANQPALMALCQQLRETVQTGIFKPILPVPGVIDYFLDEASGSAEIQRMALAEGHRNRILAYSNRQVQAYNEYLRALRGLPEAFTAGERLVMGSSFNSGKISLAVEDEIEVLESDPTAYKTVTMDDSSSFYTYPMVIRSPYGQEINLDVPSDQAHVRALVRHYARGKQWSDYFFMKGQPDLRMRDASTVYKAQGATYDEVFIDLGDISTCTDASQTARMLYVAVSRARHRISLYGQLKPAYCGG